MKDIPTLPHTPITDSTFIRQKWQKVEYDLTDNDKSSYFWLLSLPKHQKTKYSIYLTSSLSSDVESLAELGLVPGQYFVEILDMDGLGLVLNEEELNLLYRILTREDIEQ